MINARAEGSHNAENDSNYNGTAGIFQKPMFRHAIKSQRCLVLVDAFIEGPKQEKLNKPYLVYANRDRPFALAGIYDVGTPIN
jgi:putative SOS response-associated peptidase YedK